MLCAAKKIYFEMYGAGPITYRNKLNQIKIKLKEERVNVNLSTSADDNWPNSSQKINPSSEHLHIVNSKN